MTVAFILSFFIAAISFFIIKKNKIDAKYKFLIIVGIGIICLTIAIFPLLDMESIPIRLTNAFYFALKTIVLNEEIDVLSQINLNSLLGLLYFAWINILFIALPFSTASTLIAFVGDMITGLKFSKLKNKELLIFSEMNEKSIMIAEYCASKEKAIVFTNINNHNEVKPDSFKYIKINEKINEIDFNKFNNKVTVYMISNNEEQNLNDALELMEKYKNSELKVYVMNNTQEASIVLDSANREIIHELEANKSEEEIKELELSDNKVINVELVNETERAIFNLLDKEPLYKGVINNTISLLIVGCGQVGKEFLKESIWCGTLIGHRFKALIIDLKADSIKKNIEIEMPDLLNNYDITFVNADIKSPEAFETIKKCKDINYVLISMESDNKNLETAIELRKLFIRTDERKPSINIWIQNEYKKEQINRLTNENENAFDINAFGSIRDMYFHNRIVDSEIEKIGEQIHKAYSPNMLNYYLNEYNKRSSRASALHVKYKLYSILKENYTNNLKEDLKKFKSVYTHDLEESLAINEHDRWNAYMRTIGYTKATIDDVKKYYPILKNHKDYLGKRHPALVPYKELDKVSEQLQELGIKRNLKSSDHDIVKMMLEDFIEII